MNLTLPQIVLSYREPLNVWPSNLRAAPAPEGDCVIPCKVLWQVTSGADNCVSLNLQNLTTRPFSRVCALFVNNGNCSSDTTFLFPDSDFYLTVPAYSSGLYPVVTQQRQFYVYSPNALSGDETFFQVFNYVPPPVTVEKTEFTSTAASSGISLTATSDTQLIQTGINGIISGFTISVGSYTGGAGAGNATVTIEDGNGNVIGQTLVSAGAAQVAPGYLAGNQTGIEVQFVNGVKVHVASTGTAFASGQAQVVLYFREN